MAPLSYAATLAALSSLASSVRINRVRKRSRGARASDISVDIDMVACPVLAGLITRNIVTPDEYGRVSQTNVIIGLMGTGNSKEMATFQAKGIAGFGPEDLHQVTRTKFSNDTDRYLNFYQMNVGDGCGPGKIPNLPSGVPCNANLAYQQHGFSTILRDPRGQKDKLATFKDWFNRPGVLTKVPGVEERVMTIEGLGALLKSARTTGDVSGEFSVNKTGGFKGSGLEEYHPSAIDFDYTALSEWQAVTAWSSFWAAFAFPRLPGGKAVMTESELRTFFIEGDFPADWKKRDWGFYETWASIEELKGTGAGDEWVSVVNGINTKLKAAAKADGASKPAEKAYLYGMIEAVGSVGAREDDISRGEPVASDGGRKGTGGKKGKGGKRSKGAKKSKGRKRGKGRASM